MVEEGEVQMLSFREDHERAGDAVDLKRCGECLGRGEEFCLVMKGCLRRSLDVALPSGFFTRQQERKSSS